MNALTTTILNAEFGLLWSLRQLLRGVAVGIGLASGMATLSLFAVTDVLGSSIERLQERAKNRVFNPDSSK